VTQVRSFSVLFPKVLQVQVKCDSTAPCVFAVSFSIGSRDLQAKRKKNKEKNGESVHSKLNRKTCKCLVSFDLLWLLKQNGAQETEGSPSFLPKKTFEFSHSR
jgi:hypothetical protein